MSYKCLPHCEFANFPEVETFKIPPALPVTQFLCQLILFFIKSIKPVLGTLNSKNLFEERHWLIFALPTL